MVSIYRHGLQDRLLDAAASCVRVGGSLTYSVCTPLLGECDERVDAFLARHPGYSLETIEAPELQPCALTLNRRSDRTPLLLTCHHLLRPSCSRAPLIDESNYLAPCTSYLVLPPSYLSLLTTYC